MGDEKIIYIIIMCGVLGVALGIVIPAIMSERALPEIEPVQPIASPDASPLLSSDLTLLISVKGNICEECHMSGKVTAPQAVSIKDHIEGGTYCGKCHAYPDALAPSSGNLFAIHQPRDVNCVSCHLDCEKCHDQAISGRKWDMRLNHFNTLPDTYK